LPTNRALPYVWMLCGSFSFAVMAILSNTLGDHCHWVIIALVRAALAFTFSAILAFASGVKLVWFRPRSLWLRSIAGSISLVCAFYAITHMHVAEVLTITNTFPIWVALLSWPMFGIRPPGYVWVAVLCGVSGVALILDPKLDEINWAAYLALVSSVCTAFAMIGLHQLQGIDPRAVVVHFSGVAVIFCLVVLAVVPIDDTAWSAAANGWPPLMLLGVGISATIGQLFLTKAFAAGPPAQVSVVGLTQIVFALILEVIFRGRPIERRVLEGMLLVIAPTAWIMLRSGFREAPPVD
jgi:drug/metabolite transporter (DMT)-like permease